MDSIANVRIFVAIDSQFNIKLRPEDIENFKTIENFYDYLIKLKK